MIDVSKPLFDLGQVVSTPGALDALQRAGQSPWELLSKHIVADFGDVDAEDRQANLDAIQDGSRILSAYTLTTGERLWIITEAVGDNGKRASTCLLLPDEY